MSPTEKCIAVVLLSSNGLVPVLASNAQHAGNKTSCGVPIYYDLRPPPTAIARARLAVNLSATAQRPRASSIRESAIARSIGESLAGVNGARGLPLESAV